MRKQPLLIAGVVILLAMVLVALFAPWITVYGPIDVNSTSILMAPSADHPFGTDRFGRDLWTRTAYGARISLGVAGASIGTALVIGTVTGIVAGFLGGVVDQLFSRVADLLLAFPSVLLALGLGAVLGAGAMTVIIAIAVVYTPMIFRVVRGAVLIEREKLYVEATRAMGGSTLWIMHRHIFGNITAPILVQTAVSLSYAILLESALSYLGVGIQPPMASWGTILNGGKAFLEFAPWISIFPGLFIMLSVLAFNFVSDGLRDMLDPALHQQR